MNETPCKTIDIIIHKKPVWCYTLNYKTGQVKERVGTLPYIYYDGRVFFKDDNDKRKWRDWTLNSLSAHEATVRGATVWFDHPDYEGAIEAFKNAGRKMATDYSLKAKRSWNRYVQLQEV